MTAKRPPSVAKAARHLRAVPDDAQAALWDSSELHRLAKLRQLAMETGAPGAAIRLIDKAATAKDAMIMLAEAGFMASEADADDELLSWFAPLLDSGCDPLEAELSGAEFIGELRRAAPPNLDIADVLAGIIADFAAARRPEALAMMRVLAAVAPARLRPLAAEAAARMVHDGLADVPWAADIGWPVPGRCFGYSDIYGAQHSMVLTFSYGADPHALVVLIDHMLGGGIKDCYFLSYTESIRREYQKVGRDPDVIFGDLDPGEARTILLQALEREPCPLEADQVRNVGNYLDLVLARIVTLPAPAKQVRRPRKLAPSPGAAPNATAKRRAAGKNIHRVKMTLRGIKPTIWRRFEVPSDVTLRRLHRVIQAGFGWQDYHLHVFETAGGRYGIPDPDGDDDTFNDSYKKLAAVADWPGDRVRYTYDFGDNWELDIVVEAVTPAEPGVAYPRCTGGRRAGPPEDCGGVGGYAEMLSVLANPRHEEHAARLWWLGIETAAEYDPEALDIDVINDDLTRRVLIKV
ncbi:MAG TPA: plasmid pRiA4b ORF-3 family protein [Streptosporangiaceae bacterium]|nr:plasmid pRiA4b ORF-3 family protein [Streptosporangiaceae bacterium]